MDLSFEISDNLSEEFCDDIVKRFEEDERKSPGSTVGGFNPDTKNSIDLNISRFEEWNDVCEKLDSTLSEALKKYDTMIEEKIDYKGFDFSNTTFGASYQIQRSGFYKYHHDALHDKLLDRTRVLTYIWYLNTPTEGGETDLMFRKVKAQKGKLLIFPATWDYVHAGLPTPLKYIVTGWLHQPL